MLGDVPTLEPTRNRRKDGHLIARSDGSRPIGLVAVAPHPTRFENGDESRAVSPACFVEERPHGGGIDRVRATSRGLAGRGEESQRRHLNDIIARRPPQAPVAIA